MSNELVRCVQLAAVMHIQSIERVRIECGEQCEPSALTSRSHCSRCDTKAPSVIACVTNRKSFQQHSTANNQQCNSQATRSSRFARWPTLARHSRRRRTRRSITSRTTLNATTWTIAPPSQYVIRPVPPRITIQLRFYYIRHLLRFM